MSKAGDIFENPVTGESGYVRVGTEETNGELIVSDLRVRPGGAVLGAHIHRDADERFTVLMGKIGYMLGGQNGILQAGDSADLPRGIPHARQLTPTSGVLHRLSRWRSRRPC